MTFRFVPLVAFSFALLPASAETVPLAQAPAAVQKTIQEHLAKAKIDDVDRDEDNGQVIFTIEFTMAGQSREMTLNAEGRILSAQVFLKDLPPALQIAIQRVTTAEAIQRIDKVLDETPEYYSVGWKTRDGQAHAFDLWESGKLKSVQMTMAEVPEAVRKGIQRQAGNDEVKSVAKSFEEADVQYIPGTIVSLDRTVEDDRTQYNINWKTTDGAAHSFSLLENCAMKSVSVTLEEIPPSAKAVVVQEIDSAKLKEIARSFDDNAEAYDVTIIRDGLERDFTVTESGRLERRQLFATELAEAPQKTVQRVTNGGLILRIDQVFDPKNSSFHMEVESLIEGKRYDFNVGQNGLFFGENKP